MSDHRPMRRNGWLLPRVPILMYHELAEQSAPRFQKYTVSPGAFARQMRWLVCNGYTSISLDALLAAHAGRAPLPRRPVAITFDDGFRACIEHAAPILSQHGMTATFFVVAGLVGETSRWLLAERGCELPMADWSALRELEAHGFTCGSHTMSHPRLAELSPEARHVELVESRRLLEDRLGHEVRHLAYPFGSTSVQVRQRAEAAGYRTATTVEIGHASANDDLLALRRIPVNGDERLVDFVARLSTGRSVRELLRRAAERLRQTAPLPRLRGVS